MTERLDRAIALITDGLPVDWESLIEDAAEPDERRLLEELRGLSQMDAQSAALATSVESGSVGAGAPGGVSVRRWGHLELLEEIGHGAYGAVYRAWDTRLAREVALKLIVADENRRSIEEARRLARITHPNVVAVHGADRIEGTVGLWMELLKGRTLDRMLIEQGPFSAREAAGIVVEVCRAVAAIHAAGLLHRDIKAQNVCREPGGRLVLMDLGASLDTGHDDAPVRSLMGTPLYMAPELFNGAAPSVASEVYAIGVLLYRLVTGVFPVHGGTVGDVRRAHQEGRLRPLRDVRPDLPVPFVTVVERCLNPEPSKRFPTVALIERGLGEAEGRAAPTISRSSWIPIAILVIGAAAIALAVSRPWARPKAEPPRVAPAIARAFEEFAGTLGSRGEWRDAATQYEKAGQSYGLILQPDAALVGQALVEEGFAWKQAGDLDKARAAYLLGISKLQSNYTDHPRVETAFVGLAAVEQAGGHYAESERLILTALAMRARMLFGTRSSRDDVSNRLRGRLADLERQYPLDQDDDGDALPDLLEAALGLNPASRDSDGNGVADGDEDWNNDGIPNAVEFGLVVDPTKVMAHYGASDPAWYGFMQDWNRPFVGSASREPVGGPAWNVPSVGQSIYFLQLTSAQKAAALSRGWRMMTRGRIRAGVAANDLDLTPNGPRFDVDIIRRANDIDIQLNTSAVPYEGIHTMLKGDTWPLTWLDYDPGSKAARLTVIGASANPTPYRGHSQFQENKGLSFGTFNEIVNVPKSDGDFNLVMLTIR